MRCSSRSLTSGAYSAAVAAHRHANRDAAPDAARLRLGDDALEVQVEGDGGIVERVDPPRHPAVGGAQDRARVAGGESDLGQALRALLLFVGSLAEMAELAPGAIKMVGQNGLLWITYPKGGSGVKTDVNRDRLAAAVLEATGWRAVRQVAIDEVWSALRFRPVELVGK